ncbi:hypothetical protein [Amycolatopsis sp. WAC 01416]|uniref:hypothetical protein n=1 Tax=Amycolatopsis sp. WAC 01416 TaxID=2203196 RepID=UPI001F2B418C|nr:hypothetical protein [Amycolatopsis sp. WAC 01416]
MNAPQNASLVRIAQSRRVGGGRLRGTARLAGRFPDDECAAHIAKAEQVTILNTWIPNLQRLEKELEAAIADRRAQVRIMLLHPSSTRCGTSAATWTSTTGTEAST